MEQIEKCRTKMSQGDYDGAITNARSLVEAVLAAIEKEFDPNAPDYDGDLPKLYKRGAEAFESLARKPKDQQQLETDPDWLHQHHRGLSGLSNKMGDRHVREYKPAAHHAALIVNAAMTFSNFIFDTYAYRRTQKP
jgi:abortive infection Abi-like protein